MADYYTYRRAINAQRRRKRAVIALLVVMVGLCAAAGFFWFQRDQAAPVSAVSPAPQQPVSATSDQAATPAPEQNAGSTAENAAPAAPQRLLPAVETARWDTSTPVEQTIDFEYLNTDCRMVALPQLGKVTRSHFDTATFLGDSITEGMECYPQGYNNAHVLAYRGQGPAAIVNNATVTDKIRNVTEPALDAVVASQPDFLYILFGTNSLVTQGNEESFIAYYERMIQVLQENLPGVAIYIQAIPGVQEYVVQTQPGLDNARIQTVNNMLANLALRYNCYFVNIGEALNYPDGSQIDEYEADGIHFQPSGYTAWCDYLATHTAWDRRNSYEGENPYYILGT